MNLKEFIRSIPDYPKKGILFRDITTLIKNEKAFAETIDQIVKNSKSFDFDKIAAIESRGFVFASAVSHILKKPFIMLRKKNKLPADVHSVDFELEYGTATIEIHKDSINENEKVLIIDDEKDICFLISEILKDENYLTCSANDSKSALNEFTKFKPEIIIHLAAQAGVRFSIYNPKVYFKSNIEGFFNMINLSLEKKIKHFIFASSSSVYGDSFKRS